MSKSTVPTSEAEKAEQVGKAKTGGGFAYEACSRMLRPVVSLALRFGLKYHDMDMLIKKLLLEQAATELEKAQGLSPSASQLSVTTGIHRKEIRRFNEEEVSSSAELAQTVLPSSERSLAALVFALWLRRTDKRSLPLQTKGRLLSFEKLVLQTGRDVHFRSVLSELIRLGLAREVAGHVERLRDDFVPQRADVQILSLVADNVYAHVSAGVSNVSKGAQPFLEQAVWANGFGIDQCIAAHDAARATWQDARKRLLKTLEEVNPEQPPADPHRLRIGMYMFYEPMSLQDSPVVVTK